MLFIERITRESHNAKRQINGNQISKQWRHTWCSITKSTNKPIIILKIVFVPFLFFFTKIYMSEKYVKHICCKNLDIS